MSIIIAPVIFGIPPAIAAIHVSVTIHVCIGWIVEDMIIVHIGIVVIVELNLTCWISVVIVVSSIVTLGTIFIRLIMTIVSIVNLVIGLAIVAFRVMGCGDAHIFIRISNCPLTLRRVGLNLANRLGSSLTLLNLFCLNLANRLGSSLTLLNLL